MRSWARELDGLHERIGGRFRRLEPRRRAGAYLEALLGPVERKNGWQIAEHVGERTPDGVQRLLSTARWDAEAVRDDLRAYVAEHLGSEEAVLVLDETGFLKKGDKSVGVQRQYTGTAGKTENCQIGVFLGYASPRGFAFVDRALYLPRSWTEDRPRCSEAGVPEGVEFQTKPALGRAMIKRAIEAGLPFGWIAGDEVYGQDRRLRRDLEEREQPFVLGLAANQPLWVDAEQGPVQREAREIAAAVPAGAWQRRSAGEGAKGPRLYDWAFVPEAALRQTERHVRGLLVRRSLSEGEELAYYAVFAPAEATLQTLARVAGARWQVERGFEDAKQEAGLDEYEVRSWTGWHRHTTLSLLAHAFLAVVRSKAEASIEADGDAAQTDSVPGLEKGDPSPAVPVPVRTPALRPRAPTCCP